MIDAEIVQEKIGKTFADHLEEPFVQFCGYSFSRRDVVQDLQVANMIAVRRLENTLNRLNIRTHRQLFNLDPFSLYRERGVGDAQLFVAMSILAFFGADPVEWWDNFDSKSKTKARKRKQE